MGKAASLAAVMAAAFAASALLVPPARALARRFGVLDAPGGRKVHAAPTPRLGGLAVFGAFCGVVLGGYLALPLLRESPELRALFGEALEMLREAPKVGPKLAGLLAGAALAFATGLLDDVLGARFPLGLKVAGQLAAAAVVVAVDVRTSFLPTEWLNVLVTLLWLTGMTNAFNLLDNMDGLAAGVAAIASGVLLLNAWWLGEFFIALVLAAFIGSLLGFLLYNSPPASVFLGDGGALFIGFVMGGVTLLERYVSHASSSLAPVLMPVVVLAVPLVDTATVVVIRLREHRPVYVGDSRHLSHRLVSLGFSPRAAVRFIYLATLCLGLGAVTLSSASPAQSAVILVQSAGVVALLLVLMFFERRRPPDGGPA